MPYNNLALILLTLEQLDKSRESALEAVRLDPDSGFGYGVAAEAYMALNRLDEAKAILNTALQRKAGGLDIYIWLQREFAPSTQRIRRSFDPAGCGAVDEKLLGPFLSDDFGLPPEQGQMLARDLLASEVTIEESARITIQSVGFFTIFNAALQVFGD